MNDQARVWDMIDAIDICMFVTHRGRDMHGRPMSSIGKRDEGVIYLLTETAAAKDDEIASDGTVFLGYSKGSQHLAVSGAAKLSADRELVRRLWTPGAQAFWPNGPDDPNVVAIVVQPKMSEYWDGPSGVIAGVKFAFALVTGNVPDFGDNAKVAMK
ncbi:MAG: pyridoxamine 5'-phosphate oxidase family protein [Hyphomicrobium sp.]